MTIAINIAILLPAAAQQTVKNLNRHLSSPDNKGFRFDEAHHPHITLGQHFVSRAQVPEISSRIDELLSSHPPLELHVTGVQSGRTAQTLVVELIPPLQKLHEGVMHTLAAYELSKAEQDSFHIDGEPPRKADVSWVTSFRNRSSYTYYVPHITIGIGTKPLDTEPFRFTAHEIAICQLGRFCTCCSRLASWTL